MSEGTVHISSAVVSTRPELGPALAAHIAAIPDTEVYATENGKIVVVMEGPSAEALGERLELAEHEWARLKSNDSLECRNCHSAVAMDLTKQSPRAATIHARFLLTGQRTCIDCHKGIAHQLPDMTHVPPGWIETPELNASSVSTKN